MALFTCTAKLDPGPHGARCACAVAVHHAVAISCQRNSRYRPSRINIMKPDETYRVCVNFKELNKITVFDLEPMMSPDDIFPKLSGSQIYSTFDFSKGYWAIPMEEKSKDVTTFVTSRGLMRFCVIPRSLHSRCIP